MKKIISLLLCAVILLTPVMSLAASRFLSRSNTGSALQETIIIGNEYAISVPKDMFLALTTEDEGMEGLLYINEESSKIFYILAMPVQQDPSEEASKAMNKAVSQVSDKPTKSLLNDSEYQIIAMPEALEELLGESGNLYHLNDGAVAGFQLIFLGKSDYLYVVISEGLAELEEDLLSSIMTLRKF